MKRILKALSLVSLIAIPSAAAFAQGSVAAAGDIVPNSSGEATTVTPLDPSNFRYRLNLQGRFAFSDSTMKNNMAMFYQVLRFGLDYNYKNAGAVLELQTGQADAGNPAVNNTSVRRALVTYDFVKMKEAVITFAIGRDRLAGSVLYAPDAVRYLVATNFENAFQTSGEDGVSAKYFGKFDFGDIWGGIGYYNNAGFSLLSGGTATTTRALAGTLIGSVTPFTNVSLGNADMSFHGTQTVPTTATGSRALVGYVATNLLVRDTDQIEARFLYGWQPKAPIVLGTAVTAPIGGYVARDINDLEASLGYNYCHGDFRGGVWFQYTGLGGQQLSTGLNGNEVTYAPADSDTQSITTFGVGFTGTTNPFNLKDMIVQGDTITYGAAYQWVAGEKYSNTLGTVTPFVDTQESLSHYAINAGYAMGAYTLDLNFLYMTSQDPIYRNGSNGLMNQNTASLFYLRGGVAL